MKLKSLIFSTVTIALLSGCSMIYEDLEPCPQGANVRLTFCKNLQGTDAYETQVHCAKLLVYDGDGNFKGEYDYNGSNTVSLSLPAGNYHAVAYGGMSCEDSDVLFANDLSDLHHYTTLETYLNGTRGGELSKKLHSHFHGIGDFTVTDSSTEYVSTTIDLTKNTNNFRVVLMYVDGTPISSGDFDCYITADNAVTDHKNDVVKQGSDVVYKSYDKGEAPSGMMIDGIEAQTAWAEISTGRLTADSNAKLHVDQMNGQASIIELPLIQYLRTIRQLDMGDVTMQDYLDRQDSWSLMFTLDPATDKIAGLQFKINNWTVVINEFDL